MAPRLCTLRAAAEVAPPAPSRPPRMSHAAGDTAAAPGIAGAPAAAAPTGRPIRVAAAGARSRDLARQLLPLSQRGVLHRRLHTACTCTAQPHPGCREPGRQSAVRPVAQPEPGGRAGHAPHCSRADVLCLPAVVDGELVGGCQLLALRRCSQATQPPLHLHKRRPSLGLRVHAVVRQRLAPQAGTRNRQGCAREACLRADGVPRM